MEITVSLLEMPEEDKEKEEENDTEIDAHVTSSKLETFIDIPELELKITKSDTIDELETVVLEDSSLTEEERARKTNNRPFCTDIKIDVEKSENDVNNPRPADDDSDETLDLDCSSVHSNYNDNLENKVLNSINNTSMKTVTGNSSLLNHVYESESENEDINEVLHDLFNKLEIEMEPNDDLDDRILHFNELPFANCSDNGNTLLTEQIRSDMIRYICDDERPSSSSTNNDLHDSGITSSSSRTSNDHLSSTNNINLRENEDSTIPLQVVALAEGFGVGYMMPLEEMAHHHDNMDYYLTEQYQLDRNNFGDDNELVNDLMTCLVCFESYTGRNILHCYECDCYVCTSCMSEHIETKIFDGVIRIYCAGSSCSRLLSDQMITAFCPNSMPIYIKNRIEVENNPLKKTCPSCHKVEIISDLNDINQRKIKCSSCKLLWCHSCYSPWHSGLSCQRYQKDIVGKGKKALKFWAESKGRHHKNARKCPYCHFYIERISGCDHMKCVR